MRVKKVTLTNFRNYVQASAELCSERNILLGENAQGKSNFIEAIELLARGSSDRAVTDGDLIRGGATEMQLELIFEREDRQETLAINYRKIDSRSGTNPAKSTIEKSARVNGVSYASLKSLRGRLSTVSFKSEDLGLLRAGPKFRRDWIDQIVVSLKPSMLDKLARYQKALAQRNRLLKNLFESGKVNTNQRDELKIWDEQLAQHGCLIIKERLSVLEKLLAKGSTYQSKLSEQQEVLSAAYQLKNSQNSVDPEDLDSLEQNQPAAKQAANLAPPPELLVYGQTEGNASQIEARELGEILLRSYKESRYEEISRRQTLFGPHRDDINFLLSEKQATSFASQGQQRSLVLSMKLAELKLVSDSLNDSPVLLLDDVLAELDLNRQSLLMSLIRSDMQTIITTTHISGFRPEWLEKAAFIYVKEGSLEREAPDSSDGSIFNAEVELG
jgi:DNA replication and repair protein RecF